MNTRGNARAATAAQGQDDFNDDDAYWEGQGPGDGDGLQGDGGEGSDESTDATFDPEFEQDGGEPGEPGEELEPEPPRPQRAQSRIQSLANENARLKRDLDDIKGRLDRVAPPTQQQPVLPRGFGLQETDEQFTARIQLLPPDERMEQRAIRSEQKAELRAQYMEFKTAQAQDKANFDALCASDPIAKRWAFEVEKEREKRFRETGVYVDREIILDWMYGRYRRTGAGRKQDVRREETARRRVQSQETRPSSPRSDVDRGQRGRLTEAQARAKRLDGVQI